MRQLEEQELCRLMDTYQRQLAGLCFMLLRDAHLAQDAVQETFIRAWRQGRLGRETERAWLSRLAVNVCRDVQRRGWYRREERRAAVEAWPGEAVDVAYPELLLQVQQLPPREREVLLMHYWNGLTVEEMAGRCGSTGPRCTGGCKRVAS